MDISVSVFLSVYNHKKYIVQCIESILSQKTNFNYEIVIHDDASTDGTTDILLSYKEKYKEKINLIVQNENQYHIGVNNLIYRYVIPHIKGKYLAYIDGDDYWCDDNKLQKQFDYMEAHPNCSLCVHNVYCVDDANNVLHDAFPTSYGRVKKSTVIDYRRGIFIATSSLFYRFSSFKKFPDWRLNFPVNDMPAFIQASYDGYTYKLKDRMSAYRRFSETSWSKKMLDNSKRIESNNQIIRALKMIDLDNNPYKKLIIRKINRFYFSNALLSKDFKTIFSSKNRYFFHRLRFKEQVLLILEYRFNWLYRKRFKQ